MDQGSHGGVGCNAPGQGDYAQNRPIDLPGPMQTSKTSQFPDLRRHLFLTILAILPGLALAQAPIMQPGAPGEPPRELEAAEAISTAPAPTITPSQTEDNGSSLCGLGFAPLLVVIGGMGIRGRRRKQNNEKSEVN